VNVAFLLNTLETYYWYQRPEDGCPNEASVNLKLLATEVVRGARCTPDSQ